MLARRGAWRASVARTPTWHRRVCPHSSTGTAGTPSRPASAAPICSRSPICWASLNVKVTGVWARASFTQGLCCARCMQWLCQINMQHVCLLEGVIKMSKQLILCLLHVSMVTSSPWMLTTSFLAHCPCTLLFTTHIIKAREVRDDVFCLADGCGRGGSCRSAGAGRRVWAGRQRTPCCHQGTVTWPLPRASRALSVHIRYHFKS